LPIFLIVAVASLSDLEDDCDGPAEPVGEAMNHLENNATAPAPQGPHSARDD
jgi:hypothetical protein